MRSKSMALVIAICLVMQSFWAPIEGAFSINARAAVLMDPATGKVLYAQNENQRLPPASVTKVMTMLLILEAVHAKRVTWDEPITASATAAGMGGSQIYLKEGQTMPLRDMLKAIAVVSANDASAAVAEHLYGSLEDFIDAMKEKAKAYAREQRKKAYAKAKVKMKEQRQKIKEKKQEEKLREREQKRQELGQLLKRGKEMVDAQAPERQGATREETPQTENPPLARTVGHLKLVKNQEA